MSRGWESLELNCSGGTWVRGLLLLGALIAAAAVVVVGGGAGAAVELVIVEVLLQLREGTGGQLVMVFADVAMSSMVGRKVAARCH